MTLDVSRMQGTSTMAVSVPSRNNNNNLSFSISRLLESKASPKIVDHQTPSDASIEAAKLVNKESPPESPLDVDDHSDNDDDHDEDVKVNDSEDSDDSEGRAEDSARKMSLAEYAAAVHHPQHQSIDWYALYALQQQQQQHQQLGAGLLPPGHSGPAGFLPGRGPSAGGLPYLSYPSPAGGVVTTTSSSCGPPGYSTGPGQLNPSSLSPHHPHHPHHIQPHPHHPHINGGVNSAFAALLEATVFKDRLAAGINFFSFNLLMSQVLH